MMHWYCARLTPLRNTALGSGSFAMRLFFFTSGKVTNSQLHVDITNESK